MRRFLALALIPLVVMHASAQFAVLGRGVPSANPTTSPLCDVVTTCVAVYSAQRKMLAAYAGSLFQLTKTGGSTQDIGFTADGRVDMSAITTFCGTISGVGTSTTTTNSCTVTKIYDQSGNVNDLSELQPMGSSQIPCVTHSPFTVNAAGKPIFINGTGGCFYGKASPTGIPSGNSNVSLYVAGNDKLRPVEGTSFGYSLDFGVLHDFVVLDPPNSSFDLLIRGGQTGDCNPSSGLGCSDYMTFGIDLESSVGELPYGSADHDATEQALSPNVAAFGSVGDFVGAASYASSSTAMVIDFQQGVHTYTTAVNAVAPNSALNMGGGNAPEIREGFTGDSTGQCPGAWYEGAIYAATLTLTQLQQLEANGQAFLSITAPAICPNGGTDLIGGTTVVTGAWGLRQLNPSMPGPDAVIVRADNGALKVLGTASGSCTMDVSAVAAFCSGTTCHLYDLPNQLISPTSGSLAQWRARIQDTGRLTSASSATTGPTFTLNGLNSTVPVMTFGSSSTLVSLGTTNAITRPWSMLASVMRTSGADFLTSGSGTANLIGGSGTSNLLCQSSTGTFTAASTDGTWHAAACTVPTTTSISACVNGSCTTSGVVTTGDTASATWVLGAGSFVGAMTEMYLVNGTAVTPTQAGNLSTVQRAIGGF